MTNHSFRMAQYGVCQGITGWAFTPPYTPIHPLLELGPRRVYDLGGIPT